MDTSLQFYLEKKLAALFLDKLAAKEVNSAKISELVSYFLEQLPPDTDDTKVIEFFNYVSTMKTDDTLFQTEFLPVLESLKNKGNLSSVSGRVLVDYFVEYIKLKL